MTLADRSITVLLQGFPLLTWCGMRQWFDEVRREISLAGLSRDEPAAETLAALTSVIERQSRLLGSPDRGMSTMWEALEAGQASADIAYVVTAEAAESSQDLQRATESLDALCRTGTLLTLPMTAVEKAFSQWYFGQIQSQVSGNAPVSWDTGNRIDAGQGAG